MIPRTLVPYGSRPPENATSARRRPTALDERTLVPSTVTAGPLEAKSNIPSNLPLESITARTVVPRDVRHDAYSTAEESGLPPQPTELDERVTIPHGALAPLVINPPGNLPLDLVEANVVLTGEVNFLATQPKETKDPKAQLYTRISSFVFHALLIALIIWQPNFFRSHGPSAEQQEIARKQMVLLVPPGAFGLSRPEPRVVVPPAPRIRVDPRILREIAPPTPKPELKPEPPPEPKELPSAPVPQPSAAPPKPASSAPKQEIASNLQPKLESPDAPQPRPSLILPKSSGNALQDALRNMRPDANAGGRIGAVSGPMPKQQGTPGMDLPGAGGGGGTFGNGYQILTPTEGVDFSDYMQRVLASVRRNWYAVMPQSAMLGDRGRVILEFTIRKDGSVPDGEPVTVMGSGKEPLDRAAISAIRSSDPFEPLPPAFSGPEIRLRFIFLYNLPLEAAYK
jgi:TonB family protein